MASIGMLGTLVSTATTLIGGFAQANAQKAAAKAEQQRAQIEAQNAEVRAKERTAQGQQAAGARMREARLAQAALRANAGASGSSSSDPTVLSLWRGIEEEGQFNADQETASANSAASGIRYQSDLNKWTADSNASIARAGARATMIGAVGSAVGGAFSGFSRMRSRYGGYSGTTTRAYG